MNIIINSKKIRIFFILIIAISAVPFMASAEIQVQEKAHWGYGPVYSTKAVGNYLFAGEGTVFSIWDISNPMSPVKKSNIDIKSTIWKLASDGNYVFVGSDYNFTIIDVTDKSKPVITGTSLPLFHNAYQNANTYSGKDIVVSGNYAYVAAESYGFAIYDISDKSKPVEVGWNAANSPLSIDIQGNYAYLGGYGSMKVFNIANPKNPVEVSTIGFSEYASRIFGIKANGNYVYALNYGYGINSIDISNPAIPKKIGFATISDGGSVEPYDIEIKGNIAYTSWWYRGLVALDISNPAKMTLRQMTSDLGGLTKDALGYNYGVSVNGNYVYMAGQYKGVSIFDISSPPNEKIINIIEPRFGRTFGVIENGNYIYLAQDGYLTTLDIHDLKNPTYVSQEIYGGRGGGMAINGNYLYHTTGWAPLFIYDISNPAKPIIAKKWSSRINGGPYYANGYLHVLQDELYEILDVSDLNNIKVLGSYTATGLSYGGFVATGQYTYIVANGSFQVFDVSNPSNIRLVGNVKVTAPAYGTDIVLSGNYAYIKSEYDYIAVVDVSDKSKPKVVNMVYFAHINSLTVYNNYLIVSGDSTTRFYNMSTDPVNLITEIEFQFTEINYATNNHLYLSQGYYGAGVTINNISMDGKTLPPAPTPNPTPAPTTTITPKPTPTVTVTSPPAGTIRQWAYSGTASSQYSSTSWSAMKAAGPPDVFRYSDNPAAWTTYNADDSIQWLELNYSKPVYANSVNVRETYNPGTLTRIDLKDSSGVYHTVWTGTDPNTGIPNKIGWSNISFAQTTYSVSTVRLFFDTNLVPGWKEVDAVELVGMPVSTPTPTPTPLPAPSGTIRQWAYNAIASSQYSSTSWSAMKATKAPDVFTYGDNPSAWTTNKGDDSIQWLELDYSKSVYANGVNVREIYNPGTLVRVDLKDSSGVYHTVWTGTDPNTGIPNKIGWSNISIAQTTYSVGSMRLFFDTNLVPGWNEVDAVELVGIPAGQ